MSSNTRRLLICHPWGNFNTQPIRLGHPTVDREKNFDKTLYSDSSTTNSIHSPYSSGDSVDAQTRHNGQQVQTISSSQESARSESDSEDFSEDVKSDSVSIGGLSRDDDLQVLIERRLPLTAPRETQGDVPTNQKNHLIRDHRLPSAFPSSTSCKNPDNVASKNIKPFGLRAEHVASICLDFCNHKLVAQVATECGMQVVDINSDWDVLWSDPCVNQETHQRMKRFQRTNHFPLITELCRKIHLAKNLNLMRREFPEEFNFFPATWIPRDVYEVHEYLKHKGRTLIVKPDNGSNGVGISLVRHWRHLQMEPYKNYICQEYIANPFLIDGYKFDIRVYTLMTSCDPLRVYVHSDGLARFATVKYQRPAPDNLKNKFMHLTNYNVNKDSISFIHDEEVGSKRRLSTINEWFTRNEYDVNKIWTRIDDVIVKTILSAQPSLERTYNSVFGRHNHRTACFQLLGFDILLDENLNPYVLEVNHSPSFHKDTPLDMEIKSKVLHDTFSICNLQKSIKRAVQWEDRLQVRKRLWKRPPEKISNVNLKNTELKEEQWSWEKSHMGNYRLLYPGTNYHKYEDLSRALDTVSYYKDTFASQMRTMLGRAQREVIEKKRNPLKSDPTPRTSIQDLEKIYCPLIKLGQKKSSGKPNKTSFQWTKKTVPSQKNNSIANFKNLTNITAKTTSVTANTVKKVSVGAVVSPKVSKVSQSSKHKHFCCDAKLELIENEEEIGKKLDKEWFERKRLIDELDLQKLIFTLFKEQNNLSKRDLERYQHLEQEI